MQHIPGIVDDLIIIIDTLDEPREKGEFQFEGDCGNSMKSSR